MCPNHLPCSRKLPVQGGEQTHGQVSWEAELRGLGIRKRVQMHAVEDACRLSEETVNNCQMKHLPEHLGQPCLGQNEKLQCGGPGRRRQRQRALGTTVLGQPKPPWGSRAESLRGAQGLAGGTTAGS